MKGHLLLLVFGVFASLWIFTRGNYMRYNQYNGAMGHAMSGTNVGNNQYGGTQNYATSGTNVGNNQYGGTQNYAMSGTNVGNNQYGATQNYAMSGTNVGNNQYGATQNYAMSGNNARYNGYDGSYLQPRSGANLGNNGYGSQLRGRSGTDSEKVQAISDIIGNKRVSLSTIHTQREPHCGLRVVKEVSGRIIGGKVVKYGEFPFIVSIRMGGSSASKHHCGGAVIGQTWILTAAHCFVGFSPKQFIVRVGEHNLDDSNEFEKDHRVSKIVFHSKLYQPKRFNNDIAILKLIEPVVYNDHVLPTCLPQATDDFSGLMGTIMGWGALQEKSDDPSSSLQKVKVRIMNRTECQTMYDRSNKRITFFPGQICAGYKDGNKDACQGDSGGPLTFEEKGRYTVVGIVSAGIGCGRAFLPGVYTDVAAKLEWITEVMATV